MLCMASIAKGTLCSVNIMIKLGTYVLFRINTLAPDEPLAGTQQG